VEKNKNSKITLYREMKRGREAKEVRKKSKSE
jgi:hypothetical protein